MIIYKSEWRKKDRDSLQHREEEQKEVAEVDIGELQGEWETIGGRGGIMVDEEGISRGDQKVQ